MHAGNRPGYPAHHSSALRAPTATVRRDSASTTLVIATVAMGLVAGTYFGFACSVLPGLGKADDRTFIDVMQRINASIQNPVFFASFFGALVLAGVAASVERRRGSRLAARWIILAVALYGVGLLITMGVNVPLNDALAAAGYPSRVADPAAVRRHFETPWVAWNTVRLLVSTAALGCLGRALVLHPRFCQHPPIQVRTGLLNQ